MPDLPFISSNPATDEYNRANEIAQKEDTAQLDQQGKQLANQNAAETLKFNTASAGTRLRMLGSQADLAATNAQYAGPKAQADIAARKASTANAYSEISNRDAARHMEVYGKTLEIANAGDAEGARAFAKQFGQQIPPGVLENAAVRARLTEFQQRAQQIYPNRPKDQMVWIHSHVMTLFDSSQKGQPPDPQLAYEQLPGDPTPPEIGGMKNGETQQIIQSLMAQNPGMTYEQAVAAAHGHADEAELRRETLALNAAKADTRYANDPNGTLAEWRQKYGLAPWPNTTAPTAPQRPQTVPQGSAYSPSRRMWRDPQGHLYDANGQPVQAAPGPQANAAPAMPSVPMSQ
jgi:hypothetical protein